MTLSPSIDERLRGNTDGVLFAAFLDIRERKQIARLLRRTPPSSPQVRQALRDIEGTDSQRASDALIFMIGRTRFASRPDDDDYCRPIEPVPALYLASVESEAGDARRRWLRRWR